MASKFTIKQEGVSPTCIINISGSSIQYYEAECDGTVNDSNVVPIMSHCNNTFKDFTKNDVPDWVILTSHGHTHPENGNVSSTIYYYTIKCKRNTKPLQSRNAVITFTQNDTDNTAQLSIEQGYGCSQITNMANISSYQNNQVLVSFQFAVQSDLVVNVSEFDYSNIPFNNGAVTIKAGETSVTVIMSFNVQSSNLKITDINPDSDDAFKYVY